jgi:RNA polymerase-binding transcription factor DksA
MTITRPVNPYVSDDSLLSMAAELLSPHAVLNATWRRQLDRLTALSVQLRDGGVRPAATDPATVQAAIDATRRDMRATEAALERLSHHTYGDCETCGGRIDPLRLSGMPTVADCRRCAAATR